MRQLEIKDQVAKEVRATIGEQKTIDFNAPLNTFIDSLEVLELVMNLEKIYKVEFTYDQIEAFKNLHQIVVAIHGKIEAQ